MRPALVLLVVLAWVAPAGAATGHKPPGVTMPLQSEQQKLNAYLGVARSYWPGSPCAGREVIALNADAQIAALAGPEHPAARGWGDPRDCHVYLRGGMEPTLFCLVLAHELGHAAGAQHADGGIMAEPLGRIGACMADADATAYSRDWYDTITALPAGGRGWHVLAVERSEGQAAYVARRRGFLDRKWWAHMPTAVDPFGWVEDPVILKPRRAAGVRRGRSGGATGRAGR